MGSKEKIWPQQEKSRMEVWEQNSGFGPNYVRNQLRRQGVTIFSKTVRKVMKANGYKTPGRNRTKRIVTDLKLVVRWNLANGCAMKSSKRFPTGMQC